MEINAAVAAIVGNIYGSGVVNGGTITRNTTSVTGVIDHDVPFSLAPCAMPNTSFWNVVASPAMATGNTTITPPLAGTPVRPNSSLMTLFANFTINGGPDIGCAVVGKDFQANRSDRGPTIVRSIVRKTPWTTASSARWRIRPGQGGAIRIFARQFVDPRPFCGLAWNKWH